MQTVFMFLYGAWEVTIIPRCYFAVSYYCCHIKKLYFDISNDLFGISNYDNLSIEILIRYIEIKIRYIELIIRYNEIQ